MKMDENRYKSDEIDKKGGCKSVGESAAFTIGDPLLYLFSSIFIGLKTHFDFYFKLVLNIGKNKAFTLVSYSKS
jgi:hypothetical protein